MKKISKLFPLIGIIIFIYIILDIGIEKIINTLILVPITFLILALLLFIPRLFLSSYKWLLISKTQKLNFSFQFLVTIPDA